MRPQRLDDDMDILALSVVVSKHKHRTTTKCPKGIRKSTLCLKIIDQSERLLQKPSPGTFVK